MMNLLSGECLRRAASAMSDLSVCIVKILQRIFYPAGKATIFLAGRIGYWWLYIWKFLYYWYNDFSTCILYKTHCHLSVSCFMRWYTLLHDTPAFPLWNSFGWFWCSGFPVKLLHHAVITHITCLFQCWKPFQFMTCAVIPMTLFLVAVAAKSTLDFPSVILILWRSILRVWGWQATWWVLSWDVVDYWINKWFLHKSNGAGWRIPVFSGHVPPKLKSTQGHSMSNHLSFWQIAH